jgi:Uma2 family endonuclease
MSIATPTVPPTFEEGPTWEVARLFPNQGHWDEGDFLTLNRMTNRLIELVDGRLEVLEMPTKSHQRRARMVADALDSFCQRTGKPGEAVLAPYPVRVGAARFREPDVVFSSDSERLGEDFAERPDLVVEVVSNDRDRDFVDKRRDYAAAGIAEYWIIDPREQTLLILVLKGGDYHEHARCGPAQVAKSVTVAGFEMDVSPLLS